MKNDLILLRYKTENIIGTKTSFEPKHYFGSKMVDIEDMICFDNKEIQYSEVYDINNKKRNGYQYITPSNLEKIYLININDIKTKYTSIKLSNQTNNEKEVNTQWDIQIQWKNLLSDYLFYKLKEKRTFKCIRYIDVISENINYFIRDYIKNNLLNRYEVDNIDFFIKYKSLDEGDQETTNVNLRFNPLFDSDIEMNENLIRNLNSTITNNLINIKYKQTKDSIYNKFDYYYNLYLKKI